MRSRAGAGMRAGLGMPGTGLRAGLGMPGTGLRAGLGMPGAGLRAVVITVAARAAGAIVVTVTAIAAGAIIAARTAGAARASGAVMITIIATQAVDDLTEQTPAGFALYLIKLALEIAGIAAGSVEGNHLSRGKAHAT